MFLYGASGHAKVVFDNLLSRDISVDAFIDDNQDLKEVLGTKVFHCWNGEGPLIISIGVCQIRKKIVENLILDSRHKHFLLIFGTAIHKNALVSSSVVIEEGTVVMQGAIIQTFSTVGKHCIINTGASIDHECHICDYVHVSPHATLCGNVTVGEGTWIGAGSTIIQGVKIGKWCMIGAGSVVTKDIPDGYLAAGNRCKLIKKINQELF